MRFAFFAFLMTAAHRHLAWPSRVRIYVSIACPMNPGAVSSGLSSNSAGVDDPADLVDVIVRRLLGWL